MSALDPIESVVERLVVARLSGGPPVTTDEPLPHGPDGAYRVQAGVAARVGPVGAFKCGRRAPDAIPKLAPVFAADVHRDEATLGPCRSGVRLVELEIGFRLLSDPPDLDDPDYLSRLRACVEMLPALEIVDSRLVDRTAADGAWQLADNQHGGRIVLGTRFPEVDDIGLDERDVLLEVGGRELHRGPAPVPGGDAFLTFAAFARTVGTHCGGLRAGQTCITGALVGPCPAQAGDRIRGRIEGLGTVSARFDG